VFTFTNAPGTLKTVGEALDGLEYGRPVSLTYLTHRGAIQTRTTVGTFLGPVTLATSGTSANTATVGLLRRDRNGRPYVAGVAAYLIRRVEELAPVATRHAAELAAARAEALAERELEGRLVEELGR